jgi:beta-phosphoglucomutase-like phosphatase (HAD superfamily)
MKSNPECPITFDVDQTLVLEGYTGLENDVTIQHPHRKELIKRKTHIKHVELLIDHAKRGYEVIVWSGNGKAWADAVVDALGIREYVNHTMTKPVKYVDDLKVEQWMTSHIYLEDSN